MNNCIFMLRCINKGIAPVSIRLKTTVKREKQGKLLEKQKGSFYRLGFIDNNNKQLDICRSQLASIVTTPIMEQCQNLINKVRELRYLKTRDRQINKFNRLLQKQEGNITNSGKTLPNPLLGKSAGSNQSTQSGWSCSPSTGNSDTTAPDNCHNSQLGDVAGNARDQGLRPRNTTVPSHNASNSATTTPDNCHNSRPEDAAGDVRD